MSIKLKLTILFLAVALIPTLLVVAISFQNYKNSLEDNELAALQHLTSYKAETIKTYFGGLKRNIEMAQSFYNIKRNLPILSKFASDPNNPEFLAAKKMLDGQLQPTQNVLALNDIMLTDLQGSIVYSTNSTHWSKDFLKPLSDLNTQAFEQGKRGVYFTDVFVEPQKGNGLEMMLTAPAFDSNDVFFGVIAFEFHMDPIYNLIQDTTGLGRTGETLIGKRIGNQAVYLNPLRHDPAAALKRKVAFGETIAYPIRQAVQGKTGSGITIDYRGKKVIAAWRYIPSLDWGLVAKIDEAEAFANIANLQKLVMVILVLIFVLAALMAFSIARSIAEPVRKLAEGATIIGSGNLNYKVATDSKDELGQLSRTFDKMTHDLKTTTASRDELNKEVAERKHAEAALRESQQDLNRAQTVALVGSWRLDVQQDKLTWSDEAYRIFNIPVGTPLTYESFLAAVHPDDREYVDRRWNTALKGEPYDIEHRIVADGQIKWIREKAELELDSNGVLLGGFGTCQDITARKHAENELRQAKDELEQRVRERTAQLAHTVETLQEEVTRRLAAEQTIKAERKRFENVLEIMPAYAVLLTPDYHVAYANRTFRDKFGEDKGRRCHEFLFNRTEPCETCETYGVLKTNKPHTWEWTGPDGKNYDIYDYPFTDADGSPLIMEIGVDVTAHKQAQKAVQISEERYRGLTVATTQIVWTTAPDGQVINDLPSWREFTGQSLDEIKGWGWINALHPDDRDRTAAIWSEAVRSRSMYQIEYQIKRHDGQYRHVAVRGVPVLENDLCTVREWIGTSTDITERKMAQQRQAVTSALLELFARKESRKDYLDSAVKAICRWSDCEFVGIRIKDKEGNIPYESFVGFDNDFLAMENDLNLCRDKCVCIRSILHNPQHQEKSFMTEGGSFYCNDSLAFLNSLTERQKREYRGNCITKGFQSIAVVPIRYRDEVYGAIHLADFKKDTVLLPKIQFIESTIAPLVGEAIQRFNTEAELEKYRLHLEELVAKRTAELEREITHRRLIAEDLARSNKDLEQFAYVASHDLQEPLRAVAGFVELLKIKLQKNLDARSEEYMGHTVEGVKRMQTLINGLLEYSRVGTRGKKPEPTDAKIALDRALAHLHMSISETGAKITADNLPKISVDPTQLAQLFQNLISNAIKFRGRQTPEIHIAADRQDGQWKFAVKDNGIGIEPQYMDRIFLIFQRLHSRVKYPGTGIGLAICKKIVERHGGKIWVESKSGEGSTFYFTIPDTGETS